MAGIKPFMPIREFGVTELIGKDEKVDQNDYSASVSVDVSIKTPPTSGVIHTWAFFQSEDDGGAILSPAGELYIFDADPAVASGATAITSAEWITLIGVVDVAAADWVTDANGSCAYIADQPVYFHNVNTLYFSFKLTSSTAINSAAGDDEILEMNAWYEPYS